MTAFTQRHEVAFFIRSTICQWQNVMDFFRRRQSAFLLTLFAQRMRLYVLQPYPAPGSAVSLVRIRIALIFVVMASDDLPVLIAILSIGQATTTRVGAGTLRFSWHWFASLSDKRKAPEEILRGRPQICFATVILAQRHT